LRRCPYLPRRWCRYRLSGPRREDRREEGGTTEERAKNRDSDLRDGNRPDRAGRPGRLPERMGSGRSRFGPQPGPGEEIREGVRWGPRMTALCARAGCVSSLSDPAFHVSECVRVRALACARGDQSRRFMWVNVCVCVPVCVCVRVRLRARAAIRAGVSRG
jgi:hypothetical protein